MIFHRYNWLYCWYIVDEIKHNFSTFCVHRTTPGINALYRQYFEAKTWNEARKKCQEEDGHLAIINSIAESKIIRYYIRWHSDEYPHRGSNDSNYVIIGFNKPFNDHKDRTIDGRTLEEAGFAEWGPGEPITRKCGAVTRDGKLSTVDCNNKYAFMCEIPRHDNGMDPNFREFYDFE